MRTGAAAGHTGYYHEAVCYDSAEHLLAVAVPFLLGGPAAGEPTFVALGEDNAGLVRDALPAGSGVEFLTGGSVYARPAAAIRSYRQLLADQVAAGATQIRIIGELPAPSLGHTWDWWARYESAINHAYDDFPLWSMCAYDTRSTPAPVLADVAATHPRTALPDGSHPGNAAYREPAAFLHPGPPAPPDPLLAGPPLVDLTDPSPGEARAAVHATGHGRLSADDLDDVLVAVSEMVTNGLRHGVRPVGVRVWSGDERLVVTVTDGGGGPADPFAGLLPVQRDAAAGGLGLWITHQSCNHVALERSPDGFTVRLTAGIPPA